MAADLSRIRHHPLLDFAGVELKQGAVLLDADFNELVAVLDRRLRALASDVLGRATVSQTTPEAFALSLVGGALHLGRGRLYVDGHLAENHGAEDGAFDALLSGPTRSGTLPWTEQPYMAPPPLPPRTGRHLVYLDVWPRELTHLEMPALVEPAVNVESSSRVQTAWQVRLLENVPATAGCDAALEAWDALTAPSRGRLSSGTVDVAPLTDPCELPPTGGYRGLENQLYRVEVHDAGLPGAGATFKWSRENASVGSRVAAIVSASEVELETLGRDEVLGIAEGDWLEFVDDHSEFAHVAGTMRRVDTVEAETRRITLTADLPPGLLPGAFPDTALAAARHLRVRRWDHGGAVFRVGSDTPLQDLDDPGSTGVIDVPAAGVRVILEHGVTVDFSAVDGAGPGLRAGDFWVFAARTADATVEELEAAPPRGIHHHYARLGFWDVAANAVSDCRTLWPPAAGGGDCACTACVTPQSHADGSFTIQAAVDRVRESGGTVCLHAGVYALREPVRVTGARSLTIRGQGPATMLTASGTAFAVEGALGLAIEKLSVVSVGLQSAITVQTAVGLRLSDLVLLVLGLNDGNGAGIGLAGLCAGVAIRDNLVIAPDGIRNDALGDERVPLLISAAVQVRDNVLWCRRRGVAFEGTVAHLFGHRIEDNEVLGCRDGGLTALGVALPGASMRFVGNSLSVEGPGIECGVDGAWIEGNKLQAAAQASRDLRDSAIVLARGLDPGGSDQAQVLSNQIAGFADAGILVAAPVRDLICKLNIIERCGSGIVMADDADAGAVSIENNHLRDLTGRGDAAGEALAAGIAIARAASATVSGNQVLRLAVEGSEARVIVGVLLLGVRRSRIHGNVIGEIGPAGDFNAIAAGIMVRSPVGECDIAHNQVDRDAELQTNAGETLWAAVWVQDGDFAGRIVGGDLASASGSTLRGGSTVLRTGSTSTVRLDAQRTVMISGRSARVSTLAAAAADLTASAVTLKDNTLSARGRAPAVLVLVQGETLVGGNRITHVGSSTLPAVQVGAPVAMLQGNRVRSSELSMWVEGGKSVVVLGNITSGKIVVNGNGLTPPWDALNIPG